MSLHLITGYAGHEHITSADQGAYNAATFGSGQFVLDRGNKFAATAISNNSIQIADGEAMMKGRFIKMPSGTTETVTIENGSQGKYRNDLIVIRYEKSNVDNTESTVLKVIKGTETTGTATDPSYTNGDITDGTDTVNEMPLYRVSLNGINIETITPLFSVKTSMVDYMDSYQLPVATSTRLGGVKIGDGIDYNTNGTIALPRATSKKLGGIKVGSNFEYVDDKLVLKQPSQIDRYNIPILNSITIAQNTIASAKIAVERSAFLTAFGISESEINKIIVAGGYVTTSTSQILNYVNYSPLSLGSSGSTDAIVLSALIPNMSNVSYTIKKISFYTIKLP